MATDNPPAPVAMFKGYKAKLTTDGARYPCYVVNASTSMKFKDGTVGPAFKVKPGSYYPVGGWSGGGSTAVRYSETAIWVKADRVSR